MKTVTLTLVQTSDVSLPDGKQFNGFKFSLAAPGQDPASVITMETKADFTDAAAGTYSASVEAVDQDGNTIGSAVTIEVVVTDGGGGETGTFPQPVTLAFSVTDPGAPTGEGFSASAASQAAASTRRRTV